MGRSLSRLVSRATLDHMAGRPTALLIAPRGRRWTVVDAEETLLSLRRRLGINRYTLHGLRATGPTALKMLGFENRTIRTLTGHTSDSNLEIYLRGVEAYPLAREAQEALQGRFASVIDEALAGAHQRTYSGVTGRAAAKQGVTGESRRKKENVSRSAAVKPAANNKMLGLHGQKAK